MDMQYDSGNIPVKAYNDDHQGHGGPIVERMYAARVHTCKMEELALIELMKIASSNNKSDQ